MALFAAGCTFEGSTEPGGPLDNPFIRKFTWFGYVAGDDIRKACRAGAPARFRLIYNAVYGEQVRSYDIVAKAPGAGFGLTARVVGEASLADMTLNLDAPDLFAPWRPVVATRQLTDRDVARLERALRASGYFDPAPAGLELPSYEFYWTVAGCVDGKFHVNAYLWPSPRYAAIEFADLMKAWDGTGVPVNPPRPTTPFGIYGTNDEDDYVNFFHLKIGRSGYF